MAGEFGKCPECGGEELTRAGPAGSGNMRYKCKGCGHRTTSPKGTLEQPNTEFISSLPPAKRYVFTAAQNATPVHKPFWEALLLYCKEYDAELIVSGYRYRNPTSQWTESQQKAEHWDPMLVPYLYQTRQGVTDMLDFLGDVFPQATAVKPLTGFETMTGDRSCIIPHPKVQLRTVATPATQYPKIITTTGACTQPNYTETKAGAIGEFHHTFGAVVVEVADDHRFSMQQISAQKNGAFFTIAPDGVIKVTPKEIERGHHLAALVMGDTHVDFVDPGVVEATFTNDDSIVNKCDPNWLIWHDLVDLYSRNRFANNPFIEVGKSKDGRDDVYAELVRGWEFHDAMTGDRKSAVINSNHTNARLDRYMQTTDWRTDLPNAKFYLETALHMVETLKQTDSGYSYADPFVYWGKRLTKAPHVIFPVLDEPFVIAGIECGFHGHIGPGAARSASLDNMRRIGAKVIFAHVHSPGTEEGAMSAGTSTRLRLGYNAGPSSWMTSHVGIFPNGKRTHIFVMDGAWCY